MQCEIVNDMLRSEKNNVDSSFSQSFQDAILIPIPNLDQATQEMFLFFLVFFKLYPVNCMFMQCEIVNDMLRNVDSGFSQSFEDGL